MYLSYGTHVGCVVIDHLTDASYFKYIFFFWIGNTSTQLTWPLVSNIGDVWHVSWPSLIFLFCFFFFFSNCCSKEAITRLHAGVKTLLKSNDLSLNKLNFSCSSVMRWLGFFFFFDLRWPGLVVKHSAYKQYLWVYLRCQWLIQYLMLDLVPN